MSKSVFADGWYSEKLRRYDVKRLSDGQVWYVRAKSSYAIYKMLQCILGVESLSAVRDYYEVTFLHTPM